MTILPLIERELRVRARSRAAYWTRFMVALVGMLLCLRTLTLTVWLGGNSQAMLGQLAFHRQDVAAAVVGIDATSGRSADTGLSHCPGDYRRMGSQASFLGQHPGCQKRLSAPAPYL